jgi:hypothetical protein
MIIVFDDPIRDEVIKRTATTLPIIVGPPTVPGATHHEVPVRAAGALIRVVMPGRISLRRKHYEWMEAIAREDRKKIRLDFLGAIDCDADRQVLTRAKSLGFQGEFDSDGRRVESAQFHALCEAADVFLANVEAEFDGRRLGKDTITAAPLEAVAYGKPLLIPRAIPIGKHFLSALIQYENQEHLARLLTQPDLLRKRVCVPDSADDFARQVADVVRGTRTSSA